MTRGVKVRLIAFLVLSAVGIVYVASSFLGLTDRLLGRGLTIEATLPTSGGLFTGSEVTYRGVKVGKVSAMDVTPKGLLVRPRPRGRHQDPARHEDARAQPLGGRRAVPRLRAARRQAAVRQGRRRHQGRRVQPADERGGAAHPDELAGRLGRRHRAVHGGRRGRHDVPRHGEPAAADGRLGHRSSSTRRPRTTTTPSRCSTPAAPCCRPRPTTSRTSRPSPQGLADLTGTLRTSDKDIRTILQGGAPAVREVNSLLKGLEPTLPVFLSNLVTTNQVLTANLPALEQMLVVFPHVIAAGFTGTPGDGYGHINLQFNNNVPAVHQGLQAAVPVAPGHRHDRRARSTRPSASPGRPRRCAATARPRSRAPPRHRAAAIGSRRTMPRRVEVDTRQRAVAGRWAGGGSRTVFGDDGWKWMLTGDR